MDIFDILFVGVGFTKWLSRERFVQSQRALHCIWLVTKQSFITRQTETKAFYHTFKPIGCGLSVYYYVLSRQGFLFPGNRSELQIPTILVSLQFRYSIHIFLFYFWECPIKLFIEINIILEADNLLYTMLAIYFDGDFPPQF